jgi:hypothetical protein
MGPSGADEGNRLSLMDLTPDFSHSGRELSWQVDNEKIVGEIRSR